DQVVVEEVPCAAEALVALGSQEMREKIRWKDQRKDQGAAGCEPIEPTNGAAGVCVDVVIVSASIVDPDIERTPILQNSIAFCERRASIGRVVDDAVADNHVEGAICKGQRQCRAENACRPWRLPPCQGEAPFAEV